MATYGWNVRISGKKWKRTRIIIGVSQGMKCWWCECVMKDYEEKNGKLMADQITLDHIIPIGEGGSNRKENLVASCHSCNQWRNDQAQKLATDN